MNSLDFRAQLAELLYQYRPGWSTSSEKGNLSYDTLRLARHDYMLEFWSQLYWCRLVCSNVSMVYADPLHGRWASEASRKSAQTASGHNQREHSYTWKISHPSRLFREFVMSMLDCTNMPHGRESGIRSSYLSSRFSNCYPVRTAVTTLIVLTAVWWWMFLTFLTSIALSLPLSVSLC